MTSHSACDTHLDNGAPILAGRAGVYREFRPAASLQDHFLCAWSNAFSRDLSGSYAVVPDGCVDIVWVDGQLTVAGPDIEAAVARLTPGATVIGLRFRPAAAANWLGLPMSELVGHRVILDVFWGAAARDLAQQIADAPTPREQLLRLQRGLSGRISHVASPPPELALVFRSVGVHAEAPTMARLLRRLDTSERSLRRRCHEAFGYGPKTLDRIRRFQRFMALAHSTLAPNLSALACDAGYADQAHLSREVRRLSGFTPATILRQLAA